jgi:RNA recognition motif-containing protein
MQVSKLYVGNLSYSVTNAQLEELFSNHGEVKEVRIIEGKGFGFVEMSDVADAEKAKEALDGTDFEGRTIKVDEARPPRERDDRPPRGGQRGGYQKRGYQRY